jgi:phosphatidylserine decarboxylase
VSGTGDRLFVGMQHLLPQHALSRGMHALARVQARPVKNLIIRTFLRFYAVNMAEAEHSDPTAYASFNAFFTRALRPGARTIDPAADAVACPVDGAVSQAGDIRGDRLLQAKGIDYTAAALLGGDEALAREFEGGSFATIYLAPFNYHRIHMPLAGTLRRARYVGGELFSVNATTAAGVPGLFVRNERIACVFDTPAGPMAVVLVGALFVGSMSLSFAGEVTAERTRTLRDLPVTDPIVALDKGSELGRFNMGSTVIVMFARGRVRLEPGLSPASAVRLGQRLATVLR